MVVCNASGCIAAGIVDFPLIANHFVQAHITTPAETPIFYSEAMGVEGLAALVFGRLFDRLGVLSLLAGVFLLALSNPLVFLGSFWIPLAGMLCWGAGAGALNASLRVEISGAAPPMGSSTRYMGLRPVGSGYRPRKLCLPFCPRAQISAPNVSEGKQRGPLTYVRLGKNILSGFSPVPMQA